MQVINFEIFKQNANRLLVLVRVAVKQSKKELLDSVFAAIEDAHNKLQVAHLNSSNSERDQNAAQLINLYFSHFEDFFQMLKDSPSPALSARIIQSLSAIINNVYVSNINLIGNYYERLYWILKLAVWNGSFIAIDDFMLIDTHGRRAVINGNVKPEEYIRLSIDLYSSLINKYPDKELLRTYVKHAVYFEQDFSSFPDNSYETAQMIDYYNSIQTYKLLLWRERIQYFGLVNDEIDSVIKNDIGEFIKNDYTLISRKIIIIYLMGLEIYSKGREDFTWEFEYTRPKHNRSIWLNSNPVDFERQDLYELILNLRLIEDLTMFNYFDGKIEPTHFILKAICILLIKANVQSSDLVNYYLSLPEVQGETFNEAVQSLIQASNDSEGKQFAVLNKKLEETLNAIDNHLQAKLFDEYNSYELHMNLVKNVISELAVRSAMFNAFPTKITQFEMTNVYKGLAFFPKEQFNEWKNKEKKTLVTGINVAMQIALKRALKSNVEGSLKLDELEAFLKKEKYNCVVLLDIISEREIYFELFKIIGRIITRNINDSIKQIGTIKNKPVLNFQTRDLDMPLLVLRTKKRGLHNTLNIDVKIEKRQDGISVSSAESFELDNGFRIFKIIP